MTRLQCYVCTPNIVILEIDLPMILETDLFAECVIKTFKRNYCQKPPQKKLNTPKCYRCDGQGHYANECRFKEAICHKCNKKGHIKKACKGKKISDKWKLHLLGDNEDDESDSYGIYSASKKAKDAIVIKPCVEKVNIPMELNTGSVVSVISHVDYRKYFPTFPLIIQVSP